MSPLFRSLFSVFALTLAAPLAAAEVPTRGPMTFAAFDLNGDGGITEVEFTSARAERMAARAAAGGKMQGVATAPAFADFDRDGDGQITMEEFSVLQQGRMQGGGMGPGMGPGMGAGMNMPSFAEFDLDGSGDLLEAEFYQARTERMRERAMQGYAMRGAAAAPTFEEIDTDGNGQVTPEEFGQGLRAHQQQMMSPP